MWERMRLRDPEERANSKRGAAEEAAREQQPRESPAGQAPAPAPLQPPPPSASRDEVRRYRAAIRKAAVENVRRTRAETEGLTALHAKLRAEGARADPEVEVLPER